MRRVGRGCLVIWRGLRISDGVVVVGRVVSRLMDKLREERF